MTRDEILHLARKFEQYPGSIEVTLRGDAVVEFATALIAKVEADRIVPAIVRDSEGKIVGAVE